MSALHDYLLGCRKRLRRRFVARGSAVLALSALVATAIFALLVVSWVPGGELVIVARSVLYLALATGIALIVWWPMTIGGVPRQVEARVADFDGRLQTWWDASQRGDDSAMLELLTRETQTIAAAHDKSQVIESREFTAPAGIAGLVTIVLIVVLASGNSPWQLAAKRLWTGDLLVAAAPRITVSPGDVVVPRGADVVVEAQASGFLARRMEMHAAFERTDGWEIAPMSRLAESKYGFVFVGVSEEVEYYVAAANLNSQRYVIHVADLPRVTGVSLSYEFPAWTGLPVSDREDGDISALPGTRVAITAATDLPVTDPLIVVNGEVYEARATGLATHGDFEVTEEGSWHVAVRHEGTLARISHTYLISLVEDNPPEVSFSWPGYDRQATSIEEVALRFRARDDYGVESLSLNYSLNGGSWVRVALPSDADEPGLLLYLEDLRVASVPGGEQRPLRPGDMISFYAEVHDHTAMVRTALYFVDVRPFDKTYRESQEVAGAAGGRNGGLDIAERQKEIVSATWNLLNKRTDGATRDEADDDQADVLAMLQRTLKDQILTLTARTAARRLDVDEEIDQFTTELTLASEFMDPAAEMLEAHELLEAITPEQQALQHLLAAQASMTDVNVSMTRADMRGTAGRSLSELFDLEMDPERNRYEMPQQASAAEGGQQDDGDWRAIEELAERQQQLAERQRSGEESLASRWQQQRLQMDLEALRERLENQRRQQTGQGRDSAAIRNAIAELSEARDAIDRSLERASGESGSTQQASQALRRAAQQLREEERGNLDQKLARSGRQIENLLADQRNSIDRLQELQKEVLDASRAGEIDPFDNYAMESYAVRKRRMQQDLDDITRDLDEVGDALAGRDPDTRRVLQRALIELSEQRVDERLAASADAFEYGRPLFAIGNEATVERALQRLGDRVRQARRLLESGAAAVRDDTTLARVRALRRALANSIPADSAAGGYDDANVTGIVRATDALEFRLGQELGAGFNLDTALNRAAYVPRGTDAGNTDALVQMTKDRLDLMESVLLNLAAPPIRAQNPRDSARDSAQAARYFRDLSAPPDG